MSKSRKVIPTEITVNLTTGFNHFEDDKSNQRREQLEYIGFYSQTLFRMIKATIESLGDFDDKDIQWSLYDIIHTCDIGVSVATAISPLLEIFDTNELQPTEPNEIEIPSEKVLGANEIAAKLEKLLSSDDTPNALKASLFALLDAESFERSLTFNDPRIIRQSFPLLLESIGGESARVFHSAIENLIDSFPSVKKSEVSH